MIAVDTSALIAIAMGEVEAARCIAALDCHPKVWLSAGTLAEAFIVANRRNVREEMQRIAESPGFEVVPVTAGTARRIGEIYLRWGKGFHPAALNYGDCFAYELATQRDCPLLFIGNDFAQTDVKRAL